MSSYKVRDTKTGLYLDEKGRFTAIGRVFSTIEPIKQLLSEKTGTYEVLEFNPMLVKIARWMG